MAAAVISEIVPPPSLLGVHLQVTVAVPATVDFGENFVRLRQSQDSRRTGGLPPAT
jgi:hypothetical protein